MNSVMRLTGALLILAAGGTLMPSPAGVQETKASYVSPAESVRKRGSAPGMKVKLISNDERSKSKEYVVIFSSGAEAYSGFRILPNSIM
jgi:hypothetical protein